ncbi:MAG: proline--tRNA ligase [Desulfohalobiaceae bacterium]|nr:proline--tRNA ligase [Desulfohalobiaceae bacterium]
MRLSQYYVPTLREDPAEADVISHKLLLRAGMIRKLTSGLYSFLPHGFRALNKICAIVRREMDAADCQEVLLPFVQPASLWQETGRWEVYGSELLRLKDRHQRDYCLGPTHEEVITDLVRDEIRSYRQLPVNLYQIQTKFRDEVRPRFGLMRCREFIMKDAYSFDRDENENEESYRTMQRAYERVFSGLGLSFCAVEADSGPIGGSQSHEFMVLAETGEDSLVLCSGCGYAANLEKAEVSPPQTGNAETNCPDPELIQTPGMHTVADVAAYLQIPHSRVLKTLLYKADDASVAALVPGDREINETKLANLLGASELELAHAEAVRSWSGAEVGFSGPLGLSVDRILADHTLLRESDWVCGANQDDAHYRHVRLDRDASVEQYADISTIREEDACPKCNSGLTLHKGIEVGHVFKLGTKYSSAMNATYLDAEGRERLMIMGSYGIGVTRLLAAAIEQNHDQDGCFFPPPIAPFEVELVHLAPQDETLAAAGETLRSAMEGIGADVLLDDRDERAGVKFKDADLLGSPMQVIVGKKGFEQGMVEVKDRKSGERTSLSLDRFSSEFSAWRNRVWHETWRLES